MRLFREFFRFELRYQLRQPLIYVAGTIFFLLTMLFASSEAIEIGGAVGNVHRNAPFVIFQFLMVMSIFGIFTTTMFVGNAANRDFEFKTDALFFTAPIRKAPFLAGRFAGALVMSLLVFAGAALAVFIAPFMWWIDKETVGPLFFQPYVVALLLGIVPNLLLIGALFFCVASLTRNMLATYVSMVVFFVGYLVSRRFINEIDNNHIAGLVDPFGISAFALKARYWTVFERNTKMPWPPDGVFLENRILWSVVALGLLAFTLWRFKFEQPARASKKQAVAAANDTPQPRVTLALPHVTQDFGRATWWEQFRSIVRIESALVLKGLPFLIVGALAIANAVLVALSQARIYGTSVYPVTAIMVRSIAGGFAFFATVLMTFYAGEMVWRERTLRMNEVVDATPQSTSAIWSAKLTTIAILDVLLLVFVTVAMLVLQTAKGYHNYELGVYVKGVLLESGIQMFLLAVLAFAAQVLTSNKYAGFMVVLVWTVASIALGALHFEHRLYRIFDLPDVVYSDMNGYGHFVTPTLALTLYWTFFAIALLVVVNVLWARGTETAMALRVRKAGARFTRSAKTLTALAAIGFIATGCYVYYNANVLNQYRASDDREKSQAEFEKKYKKYQNLPQPRVTAVVADVAIYPERRGMTAHGVYTLVNKTAAAIPELHVFQTPQIKSKIAIPNTTIKMADKDLGYTIYKLATPLPPGASTTLTFDVDVENPGFVFQNVNNNVVNNGTFFNNGDYFPQLGYQKGGELQDRTKRRKYGLKPNERMRPATDMAARANTYIGADADWISLDTTVSTSADQTALAPGYLQKEWTENGRHYFHYKTTSPILPFWAYLSAHYSVKRDHWHDIPIEIYYDAKHPYNVDRMIYGVKKSLDYFTANFSPYQHKQVRILEFPGYASFAQSFPNTIPYSESIGFIADLRDKEAIDYVFYVTAHEVAHQWWAHQVIGGDVQGSTMLSETLAQYSALMVMEKEYGRDQMRKFLKWELDRYLRDRSGELINEMPLVQVENQPYIHYRKGSLVMYALRDAIGEDKVNAALRQFIKDHAFSQPPYPTAAELVTEFRKVTPPDRQSLITDLFETITLYDNRATEAKAEKLANGKYKVTFTVEAKKLRSTGAGKEDPVPLNDWIDIGVLGEPADEGSKVEPVLFLEKRHITQEKTTFDVIVDKKPLRAGIDPMNKLIDRNPGDNVKKL